jgi:hypothetical protein
MKWTIVPPALMAVGLVLMIAGFVWPRIVGDSVWSEEQAGRMSRAGADVHRLQYQHASTRDRENGTQSGLSSVERLEGNPHKSADRLKAELDQAREDWDKAQSELDWARAKRNGPAAVLWWLGVVNCLFGVAGFFVLRTEWAQQYIEA